MRVEVRYIPGRLYNSANVVDRILRSDKAFFLQNWRSSKCNGVLDRYWRYFPGSLRYQRCIFSKKKKRCRSNLAIMSTDRSRHVNRVRGSAPSENFELFLEIRLKSFTILCSGIFWLFRTGFLIKSKSLIFILEQVVVNISPNLPTWSLISICSLCGLYHPTRKMSILWSCLSELLFVVFEQSPSVGRNGVISENAINSID